MVQQILKGEKTLAEVSRELDIQPTVIRQWKRRVETGATTAVAADEDVVPASLLRAAQARIKELERSLGRKQMEVEILQAAQEIVKKCMVCPRASSDSSDGGTVCANVSGLVMERLDRVSGRLGGGG